MENQDLSPELRQRLQQAVRNTEVPPYLETRIRARLSEAGVPGPRFWGLRWAAVATAVVAIAGATIAYQVGNLRLTVGAQESYIAKVSTQVATLMRVGLSDHLHCAFFRKYAKNPPGVEEMVTKLGPNYSGLLPIVKQQVPTGYKVVMAHQCTADGRKYAHLILRNESQLLSVVLAKKQAGESFAIEGILPELMADGTAVYTTGVQRFAIASFESRDHLVYFISDLPKDQNTQVMVALAPGVREFLKKLEL